MFGILGWIVFGLIVGIIAKLVMPGRDPGGFIVTALLGIAGALLGGFIGRFADCMDPVTQQDSSCRRWVPSRCCLPTES